MSEARVERWHLPDFLLWESRQEGRYELVEGRAVLMAGGTQAHALIASNVIASLRAKLRGSPCRPVGSDLRIPIPATGNSRYPDVTVDCGRFDPAAHDATEPRILFEILSQSTGWYDQTRKLRDYDSVPTVSQYVCISQSELRISLWLRADGGRLLPQDDLLSGAVKVDLGHSQEFLTLAEIYEGTGLVEATGSPIG